ISGEGSFMNQISIRSRLGSPLGLVLLFASAALMQACSPVPAHLLSKDEKDADMAWLYSQFSENYAPMQLKESLYSFDYDQLKTAYLAAADATTTNEDFYNVMYQFVAEFHDAHTAGDLEPAQLPGRVTETYLGFAGKRQDDGLVVTSILPTLQVSAKTSNYPIQVDDVITQLVGRDLA